MPDPEYGLPPKYHNVVALTPGKNGDVFRARNVLVGRDIFLKVYKINEQDVLSALKEPYILTALDHENLVKVYGADLLADGEQMLLEMEFVPGGSLQDLVEKSILSGKWPSLHRALLLAMDICSGLSHLHAKRYVHRDLKPANVMQRSTPSGLRAVVTDLGLASKIGDKGRAFASQHARLYRPPEVWEGQGYSEASDVYQVGVVLYQLLGGTVRYKLGQMPDEALKKRTIEGGLFDLETIGLHVPVAVERLLKDCLECESRRIPDVAKLSARLQHCRVACADWSFRASENSRLLKLSVGDRHFKVTVASVGNKHLVEASKKRADGQWRRMGQAETIAHKNLRSCRRLREIMAACK